MKKRKVLIISIVSMIVILKIMNYFNNPYRKISKYVNSNYENLQTVCETYLKKGIPDKVYDDIEIDGILGEENKIVQFYSCGFGIAPSSKYYGFYYSPDDIPVTYWNAPYALEEIQEGEWKWEGEGDNGGKTKKIRERWYYYEAWF